jgi:hypothetical protein
VKRRAFVLAAFVALVALASGCGKKDSEAVATYKKFALLYLHGNMASAAALTTGKASQTLQNMTNPPPGQPYIRPLKETVREVHDATFEIQSEEASADGSSVVLRVRVAAKIDRPGTISVGGSSRAAFKHDVTLTKADDAWKISAFEDQEIPVE